MPQSFFIKKFHKVIKMKLNTGNKIKYNNLVYEVIAVIFSTVYLCPAKDSSTEFDYTSDEVYKFYRDFEILK